MPIEENETETTETEPKVRMGARKRCFEQFRTLIAMEIAEWTGLANEGDESAKPFVEYLTEELLPLVDALETPPESTVKPERKVRIPKGPGKLTKRRFWVVEDSQRNKTYHHVVDPRSIPNAVRCWGPLVSEVGAVYRVSAGVGDLEEFDLSVRPSTKSNINSIED